MSVPFLLFSSNHIHPSPIKSIPSFVISKIKLMKMNTIPNSQEEMVYSSDEARGNIKVASAFTVVRMVSNNSEGNCNDKVPNAGFSKAISISKNEVLPVRSDQGYSKIEDKGVRIRKRRSDMRRNSITKYSRICVEQIYESIHDPDENDSKCQEHSKKVTSSSISHNASDKKC